MTHEEFLKLFYTRANNRVNGHAAETFGWWCQTKPDGIWEIISKLGGAKRVLEIGTNSGGSAVFWDKLVGPGGTVVTLDPDTPVHIGSMFNPEYCPYQPESNFRFVRADSHLESTVAQVKGIFQGPLDFLFIDGDHSYAGLMMDYMMYAPLVKPGGYIAIDDVALIEDCKRAWAEIPAQAEKYLTAGEERALGIIKVFGE